MRLEIDKNLQLLNSTFLRKNPSLWIIFLPFFRHILMFFNNHCLPSHHPNPPFFPRGFVQTLDLHFFTALQKWWWFKTAGKHFFHLWKKIASIWRCVSIHEESNYVKGSSLIRKQDWMVHAGKYWSYLWIFCFSLFNRRTQDVGWFYK